METLARAAGEVADAATEDIYEESGVDEEILDKRYVTIHAFEVI